MAKLSIKRLFISCGKEHLNRIFICSGYRTILKATVILLPLLGITWVFGILAVNQESSVFAWIFIILNSLQVSLFLCMYLVAACMAEQGQLPQEEFKFFNLIQQGLFILIFHVIRNDKVRQWLFDKPYWQLHALFVLYFRSGRNFLLGGKRYVFSAIWLSNTYIQLHCS